MGILLIFFNGLFKMKLEMSEIVLQNINILTNLSLAIVMQTFINFFFFFFSEIKKKKKKNKFKFSNRSKPHKLSIQKIVFLFAPKFKKKKIEF